LKRRDFIQKTGVVGLGALLVPNALNAGQISSELKEELSGKLQEFSTHTDNLEEVFENREQIEVSKHYEKLPKPTLISIQEFLDDKVYYRNPVKEVK
jgi:BioD-like phosphotransacetylase family protein